MEAKDIEAILKEWVKQPTPELSSLIRLSFKAGQDSVFDSMPENLPPLLEVAHRSGRSEVVKWVNEHPYMSPDDWSAWQSQLKEWGINVS